MRLNTSLKLLELANNYYSYCLKNTSRTQSLFDSRGVTSQSIRDFNLGASLPPKKDSLTRIQTQLQSPKWIKEISKTEPYLLKMKDSDRIIEIERMAAEVGLIDIYDDGKVVEPLQGRAIFPISDPNGSIISFAGRSLGEQLPKYKNGKTTRLYQKNDVVYGLDMVRKNHPNGVAPNVIVSEGYLDVISSLQFNVNTSVCCSGTATTTNQLLQMYDITDHVITCYDGDKAGANASKKALENATSILSGNRTIEFCYLPKGEDPDSLLQKFNKEGNPVATRTKYLNLIKSKTISFSELLDSHLQEEHGLTWEYGSKKLAALFSRTCFLLPDGKTKSDVSNYLSSKLNSMNNDSKQSVNMARSL